MKDFKLRGVMYTIKLALRRVGSVKNEIVVSEMEEVYEYLAAANKMDEEEIRKIVEHDDHEHQTGNRS